MQSLFIGRRQPLVQDGAPVLYPRYRDLSEILLVRVSHHFLISRWFCKAAAHVALLSSERTLRAWSYALQKNGSTAGRPIQRTLPQSNGTSKLQPQQQKLQQPPAAKPSPAAPAPVTAQAKLLARAREAAGFAAAPAEQPVAVDDQSPAQSEKKKPKRAKRKKPEADAAGTPSEEGAAQKKGREEKQMKAAGQARAPPRASGPSNAEQAATIRQTLGIVPSPAAAQAANHFQFQFSRPAAATAQGNDDGAVQSSSSEESTGDEPAGVPDEDGEDDSRVAVDTAAAPQAQAAATPPTVQSSVARELQERAERIRSGDTAHRYIPRR